MLEPARPVFYSPARAGTIALIPHRNCIYVWVLDHKRQSENNNKKLSPKNSPLEQHSVKFDG